MLIRLLPGVDRNQLIEKLEYVKSEAINARGRGNGPGERMIAYSSWATLAASQLRHLVGRQEIETLIYTAGYRRCLDSIDLANLGASPAPINAQLSHEYEERITAFEAIIAELHADARLWSNVGVPFILDTNVYTRYPDKFADFNYREMLDNPYGNIHLIIPMVVIDELDRLKQHSVKHTRWRAGHAAGAIAGLLGDPATRFPIVDEQLHLRPDQISYSRTFGVTAQLLLDSPGHVRFPRADDEIIDRAVTVQALIGKPVCVVTYDTGMTIRAKIAGLEFIHLQDDIGDEPEAEDGKEGGRARRRRIAAEKDGGTS